MSATVDVSDSLDEARTRLLRTARALNGAWAAVLCAMVLLVLASLALLLVAVTIRPVYVVIWSVLLAATGFNVTRFWPHRERRGGVVLDRSDANALRELLDPERRLPWPDAVRLVAEPGLEISGGELVIGMPLLACLDSAELRELLVVAAFQASVEEERSVRWAVRVAHGDIGRPLVGRRPRLTWATWRLTESLRVRAASLEADLGNWGWACERAGGARSRLCSGAQAARDQVADAWTVMRSEWLDPAFARGRRHVAPFTGLRHFVERAEAAGWLSTHRPWWPPPPILADLVEQHQEAVAAQLDPRGDRLHPIDWSDHPAEVTVPHWRALVTEVLDAARRGSYDPAVTLESVLALLEDGQGPRLARATAEDRGLDTDGDPAYGEWSERFASRVLVAAIGIAAIDSREFHPVWSWPEGTALDAEDGWTLPIDSIVSEVLGMVRDGAGLHAAYAELREALDQLRIDPHEPLWLDHDTSAAPERPIGSFAARQGISARLVVVTDRAMHVFRDPQGPGLAGLVRARAATDPSLELRKRMLTVWQGDTTEQVLLVAGSSVRRGRLGPATGGLWWRLTLTCEDGDVVLRGRGDGHEEELEVGEWLGDRMDTVWLHAPAAIRNLRNAIGLAGTVLGTLALLAGVLLTALSPAGVAEALPAGLAAGGFGLLVVAVLPDVALELRHRIRRSHAVRSAPRPS